MIAECSSKAREILKWRGKVITVWVPGLSGSRHPTTGSRGTQQLVDCNQFYVTLQSGGPETRQAFLLSNIDVAYDYVNDCLELRLS